MASTTPVRVNAVRVSGKGGYALQIYFNNPEDIASYPDVMHPSGTLKDGLTFNRRPTDGTNYQVSFSSNNPTTPKNRLVMGRARYVGHLSQATKAQVYQAKLANGAIALPPIDISTQEARQPVHRPNRFKKETKLDRAAAKATRTSISKEAPTHTIDDLRNALTQLNAALKGVGTQIDLEIGKDQQIRAKIVL